MDHRSVLPLDTAAARSAESDDEVSGGFLMGCPARVGKDAELIRPGVAVIDRVSVDHPAAVQNATGAGDGDDVPDDVGGRDRRASPLRHGVFDPAADDGIDPALQRPGRRDAAAQDFSAAAAGEIREPRRLKVAANKGVRPAGRRTANRDGASQPELL